MALPSLEERAQGLLKVGEHCTYCNDLDFLPYKCNDCEATFCAKHKSPTDHECKKLKPVEDLRKNEQATKPIRRSVSPLPTPSQSRGSPSPITTSIGAVNASSSRENKSSLAIEKMKAFWASKKSALSTAPGAKKAVAPGVSAITKLNTLKKAAQGDDKIPVATRVYVYIQRPSSTYNDALTGKPATRPEKVIPTFFSRDAVVGRVFDTSCNLLGISKKAGFGLYLNGHALNPSDRIGALVENGQTLMVK